MFSWNEDKDRNNRRKHGVGFETARLVFEDPLHISRLERVENGEERWQTVGMAGGAVLLLVAHIWRDASDKDGEECVRIISARRATKAERKIYEQGT